MKIIWNYFLNKAKLVQETENSDRNKKGDLVHVQYKLEKNKNRIPLLLIMTHYDSYKL